MGTNRFTNIIKWQKLNLSLCSTTWRQLALDGIITLLYTLYKGPLTDLGAARPVPAVPQVSLHVGSFRLQRTPPLARVRYVEKSKEESLFPEL
jgi:hypothetical protein